MAEFIIQRKKSQAQYFTEDLGSNICLDMILIQGGKFLMGSPPDELERYDDESPQHSVTVPTFFMGRYPITQAQWRVVASLPQVNRELNPDPSYFKGDNHPLETVSWYDAVEFCDRLSQYTHRTYRLPTEAEWEYACRAGTTTPFYFGETITAELANYDATETYGDGAKGEYREGTRLVNHFEIANAFGLCDMHGNVWEWCLDHWHDNYDGAPDDGSAWLTDDEGARRVRRGGSWDYHPRLCRSASRDFDYPDLVSIAAFGIRVVCELPRSLLAGSPVTSYTQTELETDTNETSSTASSIDLADIIARTNVELKRLGWTNQQGRDYLLETYGKRSRQLLTDAQLLDFLHYLESEPSPTASPVDFSDIIARTNVELKRLGWTNQQGRDYLLKTSGKPSRQLLTDPELLDFLHYLESEPSPQDQVSSTPLAESPVTSYTQKELETDTNETSSTASPIDFSDLIARTNVEMKRLGWTNQQGRDYLVQTYGKRSRQLLTDGELLDFLHRLESEPSP
jgi:formylglycine-generating enzyme required for sulfatase activity